MIATDDSLTLSDDSLTFLCMTEQLYYVFWSRTIFLVFARYLYDRAWHELIEGNTDLRCGLHLV